MQTDSIVEGMLSDQFNDFDISDYMSEENQAEAWREIIAIYASYKYEHGLTHAENRSERLSHMVDFIEKSLTFHVGMSITRKAIAA